LRETSSSDDELAERNILVMRRLQQTRSHCRILAVWEVIRLRTCLGDLSKVLAEAKAPSDIVSVQYKFVMITRRPKSACAVLYGIEFWNRSSALCLLSTIFASVTSQMTLCYLLGKTELFIGAEA